MIDQPKFELKEKVYQHDNKYIIIFETIHVKSTDKQYMDYFITNDYILEDVISLELCYFYEFDSANDEECYEFHRNNNLNNHMKYYCCDSCTQKWNFRKNNIKKINDNLYYIDDLSFTALKDKVFTDFRIRYDAIYFIDNDNYIIYTRIFTEIKIFSFSSISKKYNRDLLIYYIFSKSMNMKNVVYAIKIVEKSYISIIIMKIIFVINAIIIQYNY